MRRLRPRLSEGGAGDRVATKKVQVEMLSLKAVSTSVDLSRLGARLESGSEWLTMCA